MAPQASFLPVHSHPPLLCKPFYLVHLCDVYLAFSWALRDNHTYLDFTSLTLRSSEFPKPENTSLGILILAPKIPCFPIFWKPHICALWATIRLQIIIKKFKKTTRNPFQKLNHSSVTEAWTFWNEDYFLSPLFEWGWSWRRRLWIMRSEVVSMFGGRMAFMEELTAISSWIQCLGDSWKLSCTACQIVSIWGSVHEVQPNPCSPIWWQPRVTHQQSQPDSSTSHCLHSSTLHRSIIASSKEGPGCFDVMFWSLPIFH